MYFHCTLTWRLVMSSAGYLNSLSGKRRVSLVGRKDEDNSGCVLHFNPIIFSIVGRFLTNYKNYKIIYKSLVKQCIQRSKKKEGNHVQNNVFDNCFARILP